MFVRVIASILFLILLDRKRQPIFTSKSSKPNIVFILTDDLDVLLGGLTPLSKTKQLVGEKGSTFENAFATTPVCCPSRSSILTGLYLHSHGTVNNSIEGECSSRTWQSRHEHNTFGAILHRAGYKTFYAGKYLNKYGHKEAGGARHVPEGWDWWVGLIGNSVYYNYTLSVNGKKVKKGEEESDYLTDVLKDYSLKFLDERKAEGEPFLMVVSTPSPHEPFTPAKRHVGKFSGFKAPRTLNFNLAVDDSKHWLLRLPPRVLPRETVDEIDRIFRDRWETLLAVDELVEAIVDRLTKNDLLENTYIVFSSDHGFHLGQFGQPWDKRQPYETDIRIPLLVRGPKVPIKTIENPVLTIDIAPFLLDVAGVEIPNEMNGKSFLPLLRSDSTESPSRSFLVEYRGETGNVEKDECYDDPNVKLCATKAACKCFDAANNTFRCVRRFTVQADDIFCQFEDDESFQEHYDVRKDPFELINLSRSTKAATRKSVLDCCERNIRLMKSVEGCLLRDVLSSIPETIQL